MPYEYDIFLSYPRGGHAGDWVRNHFWPMLHEMLVDQLAAPPRIFVDQSLATGSDWPANLSEALLHSRLLVAVWTPPYFNSPWCTAEWMSMLAREEALRHDGVPLTRGLVYPVVYSDGNHFHEKAKRTQYRRDLSRFRYPFATFRDSPAYLDFHDVMTSVAEEIEEHLSLIPAWRPGWPLQMPEVPRSAPVNLVHL